MLSAVCSRVAESSEVECVWLPVRRQRERLGSEGFQLDVWLRGAAVSRGVFEKVCVV